MRLLKKQVFILATIFTLLASYVLPYVSSAKAAENYITVAQAIANNAGTATVKGYIVAYTTGTNKYQFTGPFTSDTNIAIADSPTETDPAKIMPVQLPAGDLRTNYSLKTHPEYLGKEVYITGTLAAYFTVPGIRPATAISFDPPTGGPSTPPPFEGVEGLKISDIQGASHVSPYANQNVKAVEGIVTHVVDSANFYMQSVTPDENPATSEGILVYKTGHGVAAGDLVEVNGLVKEWVLDGYSDKLQTDLAMTEINAASGSVTKKESGKALPVPITINNPTIPTHVVDNDQFGTFDPSEDGIDYYESLEGMRVSLENPTAVGPQKYGEIPVIVGQVEGKTYTDAGGTILTADNFNPERMHILIEDRNYVVKTGDKFAGTVTGVVSYGFSNYKILTKAADLPAKIEGTNAREVLELEKAEDKLTVASYNIENFTALDAEKMNKIAESMVINLKTPDIIGLVEVQDNNGETNDGTVDASANYEGLINAIKAHGGPAYQWTDIAPEDGKDGGAPGGNIRVGFLYNPERVTLNEGTKGTAAQAVAYENRSLTLNPGRIDPANPAFTSSRKPLAAEFTFKGEEIIVIANHFNSKGGDQAIFGKNQPPVLGSEAQRLEIVKVVNGFVADVLSKNADANVVVLGDLNDFEFSKPITTLKGEILKDLVETVPLSERYTYNYQGNAQVLDHILATNKLAEKAATDIVHLNSQFMEAHGRVSDHDAVVAQFDFTPVVKEPYKLSIMHVNDSHANVEQYPKLTTAVKDVRAQRPNSLLVDAGDVFSGTLYFNQYLGKADLWFMNNLGYDAMTFGNHEFDKDSNVLASFIQEMQFPMVSANVNVTNDPVLGPLFKNEITAKAAGGNIYPAIIKEVDGEKVGIFGLTTEETAYLANPSDEIVFENAVEKAKTTVAALKEKGINKIVVLSHLGYGPDQELASAVDGIDVIIGGHTHTKLTEPVVVQKAEPTIIAQANEYLKFLGVLDVTFDDNGVVTGQNGQLLDVNTFAADVDAQAKVNEFKVPLEELKKTVVGTSSVALNGARTDVRSKETNLGNLITDAMVERANQLVPGTYIAMQNGGGIRASIDAGDVTLGEIHTVMPFANLLVTLDLTGAEIWQALEHSVSKVETGAGQFMQVSGIQFSWDPAKPAFERVWDVKVKTANGFEPIDMAKTYSVATNAFVADGGDGYTVFKQAKTEGRIHELLIVDYEILSDYIAKNSPVSPTEEGRIVTGAEPAEVQTGWVQIDGVWYYFNEAGVKVTGWLQVDGNTYYLDPTTGALQTGLIEVDGKKYFFGTNGAMITGWIYFESNWYFFGETGAMHTGWLEQGTYIYYLDADGTMVTGWAEIDGDIYYFLGSGKMAVGLIPIGDEYFFFDENGVNLVGLIVLDDQLYYFDVETGAMQSGWIYFESNWYFFSEEDFTAQFGWIMVNGKWYYLNEYGEMQTGWVKDNNKWYFLDSTGAMKTGWIKDNNKWYFLDSTGAMKTGWIYDKNKWYYLDSTGAMKTGWAKVNGSWYYLNKSGAMQTGWLSIAGKWYYFYSTGKMAANTTVQGYKLGADGAWIR